MKLKNGEGNWTKRFKMWSKKIYIWLSAIQTIRPFGESIYTCKASIVETE